MVFIHMVTVRKSVWRNLHIQQLMFCICIILHIFLMKMNEQWMLVDRWQIGFTMGVFSSFFVLFGPIAYGAALSPSKRHEVVL
jgi:lipoprotein signal peptidase